MLGKEFVWVSVMVRASPTSFAARSFTQYGTQTHSNPPIYLPKDRVMTVLETFKPAAEYRVDYGDDAFKTVAIGAFCLGTHELAEFLIALGRWKTIVAVIAVLEPISQKVEITALLRHVYDTCLVRVQRYLHLAHPRP